MRPLDVGFGLPLPALRGAPPLVVGVVTRERVVYPGVVIRARRPRRDRAGAVPGNEFDRAVDAVADLVAMPPADIADLARTAKRLGLKKR